jgi:hypothetical protein
MGETTGRLFYAWQEKAACAVFERKPRTGKRSHKKENNIKLIFKEYKWSFYT